MKNYIKHHPWKIIEEGFNPKNNRISESLCSLGNGHMGQRGNFEESYSGDSLRGSYMAGVYYPDKTIVGWWKNGYPEYFAKVLNAPDWISLRISINGQEVDLAKGRVEHFHRELDMKSGVLRRKAGLRLADDLMVEIESSRFVSMVRPEIGALNYTLRLIRGTGDLALSSIIEGNIQNEDANYGEYFWEHRGESTDGASAAVFLETKKTGFYLATRIITEVQKYGSSDRRETVPCKGTRIEAGRVSQYFALNLREGESIEISKFASCLTDRDHDRDRLPSLGEQILTEAAAAGYDALESEHSAEWERIWEQGDITIEGDVAAQQGIRFNIFQLKQTYTGRDERLNIGPKGFTRREVRRRILLGHRSLLPSLLSWHGRPFCRQAAPPLPVQSSGQSHGKCRQAGIHRRRRPLPHGHHERR